MQHDIVNNIRLDINCQKNKAVIYVRAGDTKTRTVHFTIVDKGKVVDLEDVIVALITITKPDGTHCYNDLVRQGNELHYTLTSQSINTPGKCACAVELTFKDGSFIGIPGFTMMVYEKYLSDKYLESINEYKSLTAQVVLAKDYAEAASASAEICENSEQTALQHKKESENIFASFMEVKAENDSYIKSSLEEIVTNRQAVADNTILTQQNTDAVTEMKEAIDSQAELVKNKADEITSDTNLAKDYAEAASASAERSASSEQNAASSEQDVSNMLAVCTELEARCRLLTENCNNLYEELLEMQNAPGSAQAAYENAVAYVDKVIADLINGAPGTLDTLKEIADAMTEHTEVVEILEDAIGSKADAVETASLMNLLDNRIEILEDSMGYPIS